MRASDNTILIYIKMKLGSKYDLLDTPRKMKNKQIY